MRHHQQRIIDADRKPHHGDDVAEQIRDRHHSGQHEGQTQRDRRGRQAHQEGQAGGDHGAENHGQDRKRQRQRAFLRVVAATRAPGVDVYIDGRAARDRQPRGGVESREFIAQRCKRGAHTHDGTFAGRNIVRGKACDQHRDVTVARVQLGIVAIRDAAHSPDLGHAAEPRRRALYPTAIRLLANVQIRCRHGDHERVKEWIVELVTQCIAGCLRRAADDAADPA